MLSSQVSRSLSSQSLLINFSYPPQIRVQDTASSRQILRSCLRGELDRAQLVSHLLSVAGSYFEENAAAAHLEDWATGGANVDRVEVTWVHKPVDPKLPGYFPSDLEIELAQYSRKTYAFIVRTRSMQLVSIIWTRRLMITVFDCQRAF